MSVGTARPGGEARPRRVRASLYQRRLKRLLDFVLGLGMLVLLAPVLLLIAMLVRLDSPGPILFRQERVGRHGRRISISRFRAIRVDSETWRKTLAEEPIEWDWESADVTRFGRFLLRSHLDRLPQLLSVVVGDMSLVGPRPPLPYELASYRHLDWIRMRCRPGLTCLWQISGLPEGDFQNSMALDQEYFDRLSFTLDAYILARTALAVVAGRAGH